MQFNQYSMYSLNAADKTQDGKAKIYEDIARMKSIEEYYDILDFIEGNYGHFEECIQKECTDNITLIVGKSENLVEVFAVKDRKILFGKRWEFFPDEEQNSEPKTQEVSC